MRSSIPRKHPRGAKITSLRSRLCSSYAAIDLIFVRSFLGYCANVYGRRRPGPFSYSRLSFSLSATSVFVRHSCTRQMHFYSFRRHSRNVSPTVRRMHSSGGDGVPKTSAFKEHVAHSSLNGKFPPLPLPRFHTFYHSVIRFIIELKYARAHT